MKRIILILLVAVATIPLATARGEGSRLQTFEVELSGGLAWPLGGYEGGSPRTAASIGLNLRYNFRKLPLDCGVFFQFLGCARHFHETYDVFGYPVMMDYNQNNRTLALGASCAWSFRRYSKINPFAELGIGVGFNFPGDGLVYSENSTSALVMPKVGAEFWHLLRVNCFAQLSRRGFNNFGIGIGLVLGGRPR